MSLEVCDISKAYGGFRALDGVRLTIETGSLFGIIGPNGAGKSTLFSVVSGFDRADEGQIRLDGQSLDGLSPPARARAGMVRTFQVPREFRHLTVRENLMAAAPMQIGESLLGLKLTLVADQPSGKLSGGQKKLLELGRALMVEPRLILLDEPFAGVNPVLIGEIMERITELNTRGIGFIIIEHDLEALTRLVPQFAVMDRGKVIAQGTPQAVLDDPLVREAYLGGVS
jgi:branched-chain amino acid transport system ATP-binding protein